MFLLVTLLVIFQSTPTLVKVKIDSKEDIYSLMKLGADITRVNRKAGSVEALIPEGRLDKLSGFSYAVIKSSEELSSIQSSMINFGPYYTWDEVESFIESLKSQYPDLLQVDTIGYSWYGKEILALKITAPGEENKPAALFTGVHHAREPIGASIVLDLASRLLKGYGKDSLITWILNNRIIWIVPVVNPDGYAYNMISDGYWRKNMRDNDSSGSFEEDLDGVDLNRNYGFMWGFDDNGSSPDPTSAIYRGPSPFSEPETEAIRELTDSVEPVIALNYHSYGNDLLFPYGYDEVYTPEDTIFRALSLEMTRSNFYVSGTGWEILYTANGDSDDWMYGEQDEKPRVFAFTPEVGENFWQPDSDIIVEQLEENWPMNLVAIEAAGVFLEPRDITVTNLQGSTPNSGDTVLLTVHLKNLSPMETGQGVSVTLIPCDEGIVMVDSSSTLGDIPPLPSDLIGNEGDPFVFVLPQSDSIRVAHFTLYVEANGGNFSFRYPLKVWVGLPKVALNEDFESGLSNWRTFGQGGPFVLTDHQSHSGNYSVTESPNGDYGNNWNLVLESKISLDLSTAEVGSLIFWHKYDLEEGYDWAQVEIYKEDGHWQKVRAFTGELTNWKRVAIDLSPYLPDSIFKFRFHFTSDPYVTADGWYIDDVSLLFDTFSVSVKEDDFWGRLRTIDVRPTVLRSDGIFQVDIPSPGNYIIRLYDVSGRMCFDVFDGFLFDGVRALQVPKVPSGIYFLSVKGENSTRRVKLLIGRN